MKLGSQRNINTPTFFAALLIIAKMWEQPKCSSLEGWIEKIWYIPAMEYYSAFKKKILQYATTWMNLEEMMLNQSQRRITPDSAYMRFLKYSHSEAESRMVITRDWEGGNGQL